MVSSIMTPSISFLDTKLQTIAVSLKTWAYCVRYIAGGENYPDDTS